VSRKWTIEKALGPSETARIVGGSLSSAARSEKLNCIWAGLLDTYTPHRAAAWLHAAAPALGNRRPVDVMSEEDGLDRVLELVTRLTWGLGE
jgi:uncharacterized protein (DUF2384 family)